MSMKYIRNTYKVPAKRGGLVRMVPPGGAAFAESGVITGARGAYLRVRMAGEKRSRLYHPTWCIEYL
jgi:hypothetical protein